MSILGIYRSGGGSVRQVIMVVSTTAAVGLVIFFANKSVVSEEKAPTPVSVRLSWVHQAQFAGLYWAKEKGLYKEGGLLVTFKGFEQGLDQATELAFGGADFSIPSASEILYARSRGLPIRAVAAVYQKSPYAFASLHKSGIRSPEDFKGKRLGISGGGQEGRAVYKVLFGPFGISAEDVTFVDTGFDVPEELENGSADVVDLYRTDQTYLIEKKGLAYQLILPEQSGFEVYGDVIAASDSFIAENPDTVRAFVRASMRGWEEALRPENRNEALRIVALYEDDMYRDAAHERHILEASIPLIAPSDGKPYGGMEFLVWNKYYQALLSQGVFGAEFNVKDAFTTAFLE